MNILEVQDLSIQFGGVKALQNITLEIPEGGVTSIIGPNGAGKTTFFNIISGVYKPTSGLVRFDGQEIQGKKQHEVSQLGLSRTFQNIRLFGQLDILGNVQTALDARAEYGFLDAVLGLPKKRKVDRRNRELCMECLELVGLADAAKEKPSSLPYGKQRKLELARALVSRPKLLLLDEPAAGLNPTEVEEFIELLRQVQVCYDLTILLIEHRLQVVHTLSQRIHVLNFGELLASGTSEEIQQNEEVITAYMGEEEEVE